MTRCRSKKSNLCKKFDLNTDVFFDDIRPSFFDKLYVFGEAGNADVGDANAKAKPAKPNNSQSDDKMISVLLPKN